MPRRDPNDTSAKAMRAARMYHNGECSLWDAKEKCDAGYESAKSASQLLESGMWQLIRAVDEDQLNISNADHQRVAAIKQGTPPYYVAPDLDDYLYLIAEPSGQWSKVGVASKIGVSGPQVRLDAAQGGNPRKLHVAGLWRFTIDSQAETAERAVLRQFEHAPGGKEWVRGATIEAVNRIAGAGGGRRVAIGHIKDFREPGV